MANQPEELKVWHGPDELPPDDVQVLAELKPRRKNAKPVVAVVEYFRTRKGVHDAEPMWFEPQSENEVEVVRWRYLEQMSKDADRYRKLQGYMGSNVPEGWRHVENLAAVSAYVSDQAMDKELDALPVCTLGLRHPPVESPSPEPIPG